MDHLVREIKENLKLGAAPPPPTPQLQTEPSPPPHHSPSASSGGKMKGSRGGWGVRHRASPYHVPPPAPRVPSVSDSSAAGAADHPTPESMAALRKKWASGRRRYPSTCMNNNAAAAAAAKNIDPDDPFAILQELISGGSLIKEAVRRLQKPLGGVSALAGSPGSGPAGRMTPRKGVSGDSGRRTAYDSEDSDNEDCRTPPEDASVQQQQQQQPPSVRNRSFPSFCEVGL